jgi:hypothetical protein
MAKIKEILQREHYIEKQLSKGKSKAQIIENGVFYLHKKKGVPTFKNVSGYVGFRHVSASQKFIGTRRIDGIFS